MITKDSQNFYSSKTASITGTIIDVDAIKTDIATDTSPASYTDTDLDGDIGTSVMTLLRNITITTASETDAYNITDPIVVTGTDVSGTEQIEEFFLTTDDGGETVSGTLAFASVVSIDVPAQLLNSGTLTFGVSEIFLVEQVRELRIGTGGDLHVTYPGGFEDTIPNLLSGEKVPAGPSIIWGDSSVQDITVFY